VYAIDDDLAVLQSTEFLLKSLGYGVECFSNPLVFLSAAAALQPGCILTDLKMPEMNGYELRNALLDRSLEWPMVLVTSENGAETKREVLARGFAGYLRKPVATDELLIVLERCFATQEPESFRDPDCTSG
jgi:two-component system response regulator FixJ